MGGGLLIDGGIHYLHLLRDWAGPVDEVVAMAPPNTFPAVEGEDTVFLLAPVPERRRRDADHLRSPRRGCPARSGPG